MTTAKTRIRPGLEPRSVALVTLAAIGFAVAPAYGATPPASPRPDSDGTRTSLTKDSDGDGVPDFSDACLQTARSGVAGGGVVLVDTDWISVGEAAVRSIAGCPYYIVPTTTSLAKIPKKLAARLAGLVRHRRKVRARGAKSRARSGRVVLVLDGSATDEERRRSEDKARTMLPKDASIDAVERLASRLRDEEVLGRVNAVRRKLRRQAPRLRVIVSTIIREGRAAPPTGGTVVYVRVEKKEDAIWSPDRRYLRNIPDPTEESQVRHLSGGQDELLSEMETVGEKQQRLRGEMETVSGRQKALRAEIEELRKWLRRKPLMHIGPNVGAVDAYGLVVAAIGLEGSGEVFPFFSLRFGLGIDVLIHGTVEVEPEPTKGLRAIPWLEFLVRFHMERGSSPWNARVYFGAGLRGEIPVGIGALLETGLIIDSGNVQIDLGARLRLGHVTVGEPWSLGGQLAFRFPIF